MHLLSDLIMYVASKSKEENQHRVKFLKFIDLNRSKNLNKFEYNNQMNKAKVTKLLNVLFKFFPL